MKGSDLAAESPDSAEWGLCLWPEVGLSGMGPEVSESTGSTLIMFILVTSANNCQLFI